MSKLRPLGPAIAALAAVFLFFSPYYNYKGLAQGHDTNLHVSNLVECSFILRSHLPPLDWLPDIAGGRGGPNFMYYGTVLPFYAYRGYPFHAVPGVASIRA